MVLYKNHSNVRNWCPLMKYCVPIYTSLSASNVVSHVQILNQNYVNGNMTRFVAQNCTLPLHFKLQSAFTVVAAVLYISSVKEQ